MLFDRRKWALRITEHMGLPAKDPRTTAIVSMLVQGSKQFGRLAKGSKTTEQVLMAAAALRDNQSAIDRYVSEQNYTIEQALHELTKAKTSAKALATEYDLTDLLESPWFK